jgi:inhibitor of cysteine peptidase
MNYLLFLGWSLVAAVSESTEKGPLRVMLPTEQVTQVAPGETFQVILEGNITTGYGWTAVKVPAGLVQVGEVQYVNPEVKPGDRPMPGRGGRFVFTFKAKSVSHGALSFAYARPWEKDVPPAKTAELKFIVQEK